MNAPAVLAPAYGAPLRLKGGTTPFDRLALLGLVGWIVLAITYVVPGAKLVIMAGMAGLLADRLFGWRRLELGGSIGTWLLAYSAAIVVATPTSIWLGQSVSAIQEQVKLLLVFVLVVGASRSDSRREWLLRLTVLLLVLFPARGALLAQLHGAVKVAGRADWQGLFGNANMLAATLTLFLPFAIVWMRFERRPSLRIMWGIFAVLLAAATLSSQSRSGMLSLVIVLGWALAASRHRAKAAILIGGLCLGAIVVSPTGMNSRIASVMYSITGETPPEEAEGDVGNASSRLFIWRAALDMVYDNPVLGVGPGTFEEAHRHYQTYVQWSAGALWIDTHNSFLRVWSETGTVGLIAFTGIFVTVFRRGRRGLRALRRVGLGWSYDAQMLSASLAGVLAWLIANLFNTFKDVWLFYLFLGFCVLITQRAFRIASYTRGWRLDATSPSLLAANTPAPLGRT